MINLSLYPRDFLMELSSLIDRLPSMVKVSVSVAILSFFRCKTLIQFKQSNLSFPVTKLLYVTSLLTFVVPFDLKLMSFHSPFYHLWNSLNCCEYITDFVQVSSIKFWELWNILKAFHTFSFEVLYDYMNQSFVFISRQKLVYFISICGMNTNVHPVYFSLYCKPQIIVYNMQSSNILDCIKSLSLCIISRP